MIDPDAIEGDYPRLAQALGGGSAARNAVSELVALLRRAGVEVPGYPADDTGTGTDDDAGTGVSLDEDTAITRSEFFQVITGTVPERLTE